MIVSFAEVRALRAEAVARGDAEQVALCDAALSDDDQAFARCAIVIIQRRMLNIG